MVPNLCNTIRICHLANELTYTSSQSSVVFSSLQDAWKRLAVLPLTQYHCSVSSPLVDLKELSKVLRRLAALVLGPHPHQRQSKSMQLESQHWLHVALESSPVHRRFLQEWRRPELWNLRLRPAAPSGKCLIWGKNTGENMS